MKKVRQNLCVNQEIFTTFELTFAIFLAPTESKKLILTSQMPTIRRDTVEASHLNESARCERMAQNSAKPTILIVDDEVEILKVLRKTLEDDYTVLTASRAREALDMIGPEVQVILSDQRMPEMTGSEFFRIVRERHPDVVRIIMTGYSDMNALIDSVNQGEIFRYLSKPWDLRALLETVREAVDRHAMLMGYRQLADENKSLSEKYSEEMQRLNHTIGELERAKTEIARLRSR